MKDLLEIFIVFLLIYYSYLFLNYLVEKWLNK
jgi:hypothetical protein